MSTHSSRFTLDTLLPVSLASGIKLDRLRPQHEHALAGFFEGLSEASKSRFRSHPMTRQSAESVCRDIGQTDVVRCVLVVQDRVIGYFILDPSPSIHEARRYLARMIVLAPTRDFMFAACIADAYQWQGLASRAMPHLICVALARGAHSLVLTGGVQDCDTCALGFYERWGFVRHGGYNTHVFNHDLRLALYRNGPVSIAAIGQRD